jgi:hypothetical protein
MKREFRVTIDAHGNQAAEEFLNTLRKVAQKAEFEHGISVDVQRLETTDVEEASFRTGAEYGD